MNEHTITTEGEVLYNTDNETALLHWAMRTPSLIAKIQQRCPAKCFFDTGNRVAMEALVDIQSSRKGEVSPIPAEYVKQRTTSEAAHRAIDNASPQPMSFDTTRMIDETRVYYQRRQVEYAFRSMTKVARDPLATVAEIKDAAAKALFNIDDIGTASVVSSEREAMEGLIDQLKAYKERADQGLPPGVRIGIEEMEEALLGWQGSRLYTLAARPGVGKTALAECFATNADCRVLYFTIEMPKEELMSRRVLPELGISYRAAVSGKMTKAQWDSMEEAAKTANDSLRIVDQSTLSLDEIKEIARSEKAHHSIGMIIIDYMQLVSASTKRNATREQEVSAISRGLKALAKELDIPVIALAQLGRIEETDRPGLHNLRESGAIEQDSDVVMFLWREPNLPNGDVSRVLNWGLAKNRSGGLRSGKLTYKGDSSKLVPYSEREAEVTYSDKLF